MEGQTSLQSLFKGPPEGRAMLLSGPVFSQEAPRESALKAIKKQAAASLSPSSALADPSAAELLSSAAVSEPSAAVSAHDRYQAIIAGNQSSARFLGVVDDAQHGDEGSHLRVSESLDWRQRRASAAASEPNTSEVASGTAASAAAGDSAVDAVSASAASAAPVAGTVPLASSLAFVC
ncbi:hypothetical protein Esti_003851 [Eimeria stiedai]